MAALAEQRHDGDAGVATDNGYGGFGWRDGGGAGDEASSADDVEGGNTEEAARVEDAGLFEDGGDDGDGRVDGVGDDEDMRLRRDARNGGGEVTDDRSISLNTVPMKC